MADSTNQTPSAATKSKVDGGFTTSYSDLGKNYWSEGPIPEFTQLIGGFNLTAYKFPEDGSTGIALYNGKVAFHIDNNNNITFSAGPPSQSGCGGKLVMNSQAQIQKSKSVSIEVTGRDDGGTTNKETDEDGNVSEDTLPAYSLKVYGPVYVEAIGGDACVKGDNVTVNASSTLNLKSGKDINIQAGENGGKILMNGGTFELNTAFFNKNTSAGEYSEGAGEFKVTQNKGGASVEIDTPGSVSYNVNGDYTVGVSGDYTVGTKGHYNLNIDKNAAYVVKGNYSVLIDGKMKTEIQGIEAKGTTSSQLPNYLLKVAVPKKKTDPSFLLDTGGRTEFKATTGGYKFEVGKQLGSIELTDKNKFSVTTGSKLGSILLDEKQALIEYGKSAKMVVSPKTSSLETSKTSKVTVGLEEVKVENGGSYVSVKPSDVTVFGPMIYLN